MHIKNISCHFVYIGTITVGGLYIEEVTTEEGNIRMAPLGRRTVGAPPVLPHLKKEAKSTKKVAKMVIAKIPSAGTIQAKKRFKRLQHFPKK